MKDFKINKYDLLLFVLILCTAGGMWGGALKPARLFSIIFAVPLIMSYKKVEVEFVKVVFLFLLFLIIWGFISLSWSPDAALGFFEWGNMILRILFFLELMVFGLLSKNTFNTMVNGWSIAFLITAIIAVWELNTGNHLAITRYAEEDNNLNLGNGISVVRQFSAATFYNYNGYVTFVCYCLPFLFSLAIKCTRGIKQLMAAVPIMLVLYVFVLNASRGGLVAFFIYAAIFSFFKLSKSKLSVKVTFIALTMGFFIVFAYFWDLISFYLEYKMESGGMSSSRTQIWACCWQALVQTGFIGCGVGGVMDALDEQHAYVNQPHNFFMEVLLEFGVIVFIWLIFLMWNAFWMGRKCEDNAINYVRISSFLAIPFITILDSEYVQNIGIWAFLGSLLILNVKCKNTDSINA